jgi:hypothetical protein
MVKALREQIEKMVDKVRAIAADNAAVVGKLSTVFSAVKEMKLTLFIVSAALGAMVVVPLLLQWNETDTLCISRITSPNHGSFGQDR